MSSYVEIKAATHYEFGRFLGNKFSSQIQDFITNFAVLHKQLIPFCNTHHGKLIFEEYIEVNNNKYPHYIEEIRGMSEGANVPMETLLLLNLMREIRLNINNNISPADANCGEIHFSQNGKVALIHIEDGDIDLKNSAFIVSAEIAESQQKFVCYMYPGILAGIAWGYNQSLVIGCDAVYPAQVVRKSLGRVFINRDICAANSVEDAISRATPPNRASGYSLNLGDIKNKKTYNIEVAPTVYSVYENTLPCYYHWNMYDILNIKQLVDPSSVHRKKRVQSLPIPRTLDEAMNIAADTGDKEYPIFRSQIPPDEVATVAIVLFDLSEGTALVWLDNPTTSKPVYKWLL